MIIALIIFIIVLIFAAIFYYFFSLAFLRKKTVNSNQLDDVDSDINKPLAEFKELMRKGIDYIKSQSHIWVYITSFDGLKLAARYYENNTDKTIILFHGYRSSATRDFSTAVKMYMDFGFNVLLCDQRSHGKSEGKFITFGVKESKDVISWVNFIKEKYNTEKIILGGMSMGATTVLLAVAHNLPHSVKGIIADCGFSSPAEIINIVAKRYFKINAKYLLPIMNVVCLFFGKFSIYKSNTVNALKKSSIPILFVHGDSDTFVPCEMSIKAYEITKEHAKLLLINGADHGISYFIDTITVESELNDFLKLCM